MTLRAFGYEPGMRNMKVLTFGTAGALLAASLPAMAAPDTQAAALTALQTIKSDATAISAGKYATKADLQAPAREIALAWNQAAGILGKDGNVRVEMKVANDSITEFERDWQELSKARVSAKNVSTSVGDLIDATKGSGSSS